MISSMVAPAFQRVLDMTPGAGRVHVRKGGIKGDAKKFYFLGRV